MKKKNGETLREKKIRKKNELASEFIGFESELWNSCAFVKKSRAKNLLLLLLLLIRWRHMSIKKQLEGWICRIFSWREKKACARTRTHTACSEVGVSSARPLRALTSMRVCFMVAIAIARGTADDHAHLVFSRQVSRVQWEAAAAGAGCKLGAKVVLASLEDQWTTRDTFDVFLLEMRVLATDKQQHWVELVVSCFSRFFST